MRITQLLCDATIRSVGSMRDRGVKTRRNFRDRWLGVEPCGFEQALNRKESGSVFTGATGADAGLEAARLV
jgi:hypothetical protein